MTTNFTQIKQFTDKLQDIFGYGTEDFSIFLYSIIKMRKPKNIVELGTGTGSVMLWAGIACKENGFGNITTIDNGVHWNKKIQKNKFIMEKNYNMFINNIIMYNEIQEFVKFKNEDIDIKTINDNTDIDILFVDFNHTPVTIKNIMSSAMSRMSEESIIFFDSASTYLPSYLFLENIVNSFNKKKIPKDFNFDEKAKNLILNSRFTLTHLIEKKNRDQNSTAMIEIKPENSFPNSEYIRF
jgi:hypothetical protein